MTLKDVKKYLTSKTLLVGIIVLLVGGGVYSTFNLRSKLDSVRSELAAARLDKSIIEAEKYRLDSLIRVLNGSIKDRDGVIAKKDLEIRAQNIEIDVLRARLSQALVDLQVVTADSSYKYITQRVKATSELKYKFDSTQVRNIHYTYVERDGLFNLNTKYSSTIANYQKNFLLKDAQIADLKNLNITYVRKTEIYRKENNAYELQVEGLNRTVRKQKFMKNVGIGTAVGLVTYIVINSFK